MEEGDFTDSGSSPAMSIFKSAKSRAGDAEVELLCDDLWLFSGYFGLILVVFWLIPSNQGKAWLMLANSS